MTPCKPFQDQLIDYDELGPDERLDVDAHLTGCMSCREYLAILHDIDVALAAHSSSIRLGAERVAAIRRAIDAAVPVRRVSARSEWLDFVAASAVVAYACGLAWSIGLVGVAVLALSSLTR